MPWCSVKLCEVIPLVVIVALGDVYSVLIQWMNDSTKPNVWRVLNKNDQFTLSKAFSASSEMIMVFCCVSCDILNRLNSLQTLTVACLFFMKPV